MPTCPPQPEMMVYQHGSQHVLGVHPKPEMMRPAFQPLNTKQLDLFGPIKAIKEYEETDLEVVNVPITPSLFLSYNVKDVTYSTSKKKRIVCLQVNKRYVSKQGQDRVWNIKIQDEEIDRVLQGLAYLNKEYILKQ